VYRAYRSVIRRGFGPREVVKVGKTVLTPVGVKVVSLVLVLALVFGWSATAYAQTSAKAQYGNPAPRVTVPGGGGGTASAKGGGGTAKAKVLPATGGPLLPPVALGAFALGATGLFVLRQLGRR
jgi:hypothetical protein